MASDDGIPWRDYRAPVRVRSEACEYLRDRGGTCSRPVDSRGCRHVRQNRLVVLKYREEMHPFSRSERLKIVAMHFAMRTAFVAAVLLLSLVPGVSVLAALVVVSLLLFAFSALQTIMIPTRLERSGPGSSPGGAAGDRYPRRPRPSRPAGTVERPLPTEPA